MATVGNRVAERPRPVQVRNGRLNRGRTHAGSGVALRPANDAQVIQPEDRVVQLGRAELGRAAVFNDGIGRAGKGVGRRARVDERLNGALAEYPHFAMVHQQGHQRVGLALGRVAVQRVEVQRLREFRMEPVAAQRLNLRHVAVNEVHHERAGVSGIRDAGQRQGVGVIDVASSAVNDGDLITA